jgi:hypothetical protein
MAIPSDQTLAWLEKVVSDEKVDSQLRPIVSRVRARLERKNEPMVWEALPSNFFDQELPCQIASTWIFIIRAGTYLGVERHSNSYQRTIALQGGGLFELYDNGIWKPYPISSIGDERSVSIPQNTWHRVTAGPEDWAMISFHTVPAAELVEEKPVNEEHLEVTHARKYSLE